MNNILVTNNEIKTDNKNIIVCNNKITFLESGTYFIEYKDSSLINLIFEINDFISVNLSEISFDNNLTVNNSYIVNSGFMTVNKFYSNKSVDEKIKIDLNGEGARFDYKFSNICILDEKYLIDINHNSKCTISNVYNRSVALDNSKLNFVINSNVPKEMNKSIIDQNTKIITFGDALASISPNMFIDTYDVDAKHGSVVGTVNEDIMFYLMSRGISKKDALKLVIRGYLFSNVINDLDIKTRILKVIDMYWR